MLELLLKELRNGVNYPGNLLLLLSTIWSIFLRPLAWLALGFFLGQRWTAAAPKRGKDKILNV
jgi:hypothetical protein